MHRDIAQGHRYGRGFHGASATPELRCGPTSLVIGFTAGPMSIG
jgi:hypothetical protein